MVDTTRREAPARQDGYAAIEDYAAIGDGHRVGLVCKDGAIDWLCVPTMDAPPVFGALLDPDHGGFLGLAPEEPYEVRRRYLDDTNVLETVFTTDTGVLRVTDALNTDDTNPLPWGELARRVECQSGSVRLRWDVAPGTLFGTRQPWAAHRDGVPLLYVGGHRLVVCAYGVGEPELADRTVGGARTLRAGESGVLGLVMTQAEPIHVPKRDEIELRLDRTVESWRRWTGRIQYRGPWREAVVRSALALKLLIFSPSGAIVAAPTTSLPEAIGGPRNYDYRYAWVRDSSYILDALNRLGLQEEVTAALSWLLTAIRGTEPRLYPFYRIDGAVTTDVTRLELPGYRGSRPVRSGNDAEGQLQLGPYGDLLDAVWQFAQRDNLLDATTAGLLNDIADQVCDIWQRRDSGIWELGELQHYTISKIGCWVALDRAIRLAEAGQLDSPHVQRWRMERRAIRRWVDEHCWSETKQAYTAHAGTAELDAAVLLAGRTRFLDGGDPRLGSTIDAVRDELGRGTLLYRYGPLVNSEGAFVACGFWLANALAHAKRWDEASAVMDGMLEYTNDVGLYSEEIDPRTGGMLGNFPQGLSHLALVMAAADYVETESGAGQRST